MRRFLRYFFPSQHPYGFGRDTAEGVATVFSQSANKEFQKEAMFLSVSLFDQFLTKQYFTNKRDLKIVAIATSPPTDRSHSTLLDACDMMQENMSATIKICNKFVQDHPPA
ncbi:uncharacterized protein LOC122195542 isoform X2 [Lactuca sativa]|uniref:uncharacterized protein LOC122195542 isoform X2 n=1 Tax=Lactuca sativa TaxID=4236 RepID=UPI001C693921|nr:uncharacterized protein LOC122195542 isoform X2 [Lactuca sativa]